MKFPCGVTFHEWKAHRFYNFILDTFLAETMEGSNATTLLAFAPVEWKLNVRKTWSKIILFSNRIPIEVIM